MNNPNRILEYVRYRETSIKRESNPANVSWELILDFNEDIHHSVVFTRGMTRVELSARLNLLAERIKHDPPPEWNLLTD